MIFTFSSAISLRRKLGYIGAMLLVMFMLLTSMAYQSGQSELIMDWAIVCLVGGLSLLFLVTMFPGVNSAYSNWSPVAFALLMSILPVIVSIALYVIFIFMSFEDAGEKLLLYNIGLFPINIPIILISAFLLKKLSENQRKSQ